MKQKVQVFYGLDLGQEKLFGTKFNHRKWHKICKMADLAYLKSHDLRKTFCSLLAQNGKEWIFYLNDFIQAIEKAKQRLWEMRKTWFSRLSY